MTLGHTQPAFGRTSAVGGIEQVDPGCVGMPLERASVAAVRDADPGADWSAMAAERLERATRAE